MGVLATATIHPRHTDKRTAREHATIAARFAGGAREIFAALTRKVAQ